MDQNRITPVEIIFPLLHVSSSGPKCSECLETVIRGLEIGKKKLIQRRARQEAEEGYMLGSSIGLQNMGSVRASSLDLAFIIKQITSF